jgi:hypothetical protein
VSNSVVFTLKINYELLKCKIVKIRLYTSKKGFLCFCLDVVVMCRCISSTDVPLWVFPGLVLMFLVSSWLVKRKCKIVPLFN